MRTTYPIFWACFCLPLPGSFLFCSASQLFIFSLVHPVEEACSLFGIAGELFLRSFVLLFSPSLFSPLASASDFPEMRIRSGVCFVHQLQTRDSPLPRLRRERGVTNRSRPSVKMLISRIRGLSTELKQRWAQVARQFIFKLA